MSTDLPLNLILYSAGAFVVGWILSAISSRMTNKHPDHQGNSNDHRIRSLEADQRVAQAEAEKAKEKREKLEDELKEANEGLDKRDLVITHQQEQIDKFKQDLKVSVRKTRELRAELTNRASENIKSEAKLREVETELEVAHVSADRIATGVLDYSLAEEFVEDESDGDTEEDDDRESKGGDDSILGKAIKDF